MQHSHIHGTLAAMNTLTECLAGAEKHGYTEHFTVTQEGLMAPSNNLTYRHEEVMIADFFRFEGASNPDDMSILYLIETHNDGPKGTLVDAYGTYADEQIGDFITAVQEIQKKAAQ